jgi:sporulation protein YlmC with PRC-barrel domain
MKTLVCAALAMCLTSAAAFAQSRPDNRAAYAQAPPPIAGIDEAALAGSARASKLIGSRVYQGDTSIGHIEDMLVDLDRTSLTAVILSVGGFLGLGDKLVAVPVNQIKVSSEARFTTDLTREQLAGAPAFDFGKLKP